jgi:hypothetical protein
LKLGTDSLQQGRSLLQPKHTFHGTIKRTRYIDQTRIDRTLSGRHGGSGGALGDGKILGLAFSGLEAVEYNRYMSGENAETIAATLTWQMLRTGS